MSGAGVGGTAQGTSPWVTSDVRLPASLGQATSANSLPVVIASDQSAFPVSQNGTWTVQQGTTGAGAAHPWSMELSDGASFYVGAKTGQLPTALGTQNASGALCTVPPIFSTSKASTLPTTGQVVKNTPGSLSNYQVSNTTGGTIFIQFFDLAAGPPANGALPLFYTSSVASGGTQASSIGPSGVGWPFPSNGILMVASSTMASYTAIVSTAIQWSAVFL